VTIESIERTNLTLSVGAVALTALVAPAGFAWSVAAGALLETLNLRGLLNTARRFFGVDGFGNGALLAIYAMRFGWLALAIGAALYLGAHPVGLLLGLSLVVPAALYEGWRRRGAPSGDAITLAPDDPEWDRWNPWLARERAETGEEDE